MPDAPVVSWKKRALKLTVAVVVAAVAALVSRERIGATNWQETIARLPTWGLVLLVVCAPAVWLLIEFLDAFFKELVDLARGGGRSAARLVGQGPEALKNVLGRGWDKVAACLCRHSFDGRYRKRVYEDYGLFNDRGLGLINAARLDLEKVFVELQVGSAQLVPTQMELLRHSVEGRRTVWDFLRAVRPGRGLALIGPPGCGKTTLLQHLLLVFAANRQGRHRQRRLLPILVELRSLKESFEKKTPPTLADAIRSYWKTSSKIADLMEREPAGWLEQRLRSSRVLLLFDGLDEVPQAQRAQVSRWVQEQMRHEDYRRCLFLLTSRPGGYVEAPLEGATVLQVQPFSPEQTNKFIDGWYLANEIVASGNKDDEPVRRRAAQEADDLRKRLRGNPDLYDLTVNPLLLTMVCMVHRYHGALPGSRSQLYGEICQVLLERWRQAKGIAEELKGEQKLAVLRPLAAKFMQEEARELPESDLLPIIAAPLASVGYGGEGDVTAGQRFLRFIQASSGLMLERERGRWSFAHKTFQEYLTSEHWLRSPNLVVDWVAKVPSVWWRETLLLYAARTDASGLVEAALAQGSLASWGLAYQCLSEAQSLRPEVRVRAESTLRQALHSTDSAVFSPAATAVHHLRQREVRAISDKVEQRATLVTQAEYQLFLNCLSADDRFAMLPPHWTSPHFAGASEAPILGALPWQASSFAEWAHRGASPLSWRLPARREPAEVSLSNAVFWHSNGTLSPAPPEVTDMMEDWAKSQDFGTTQRPTLTDAALALSRALDLYRGRACALDLALALAGALELHRGRARDLYRDRDLDLSYALAHALNLARALAHALALDSAAALRLARDLGHDRARALARDLYRDRGFDLAYALAHDINLARALARDLDLDLAYARALDLTRDLALALDLNLALALARARDRDLALARALAGALALALTRACDLARALDLDRLSTKAQDLRLQVLNEGESVSRRRMQLLVCLLDVLCAGDDQFAVRKAWRDYAICLLGMGLPNLSKKHRDELAPIQFALCLLRAREAGEVQPYEGILLVRDRKPS